MSDIKHAFPSRFKGGVILEADFSQLEVVGLALLSRDPQLLEDILTGMDTHTYWASKLFDKPEAEVTKKERQIAKIFNFQLQYGSGAKNMAASQGVKKELAESFIQMYYERYKRVKKWQDEVAIDVEASRRPYKGTTKKGLPRSRGTYRSATGRLYSFLETDWGDEASFSPTQMKNYPVQGFATGDIMALYRARVYRRWVEAPWRAEGLPINTVHDSVMFDCANEDVAEKVRQMLEEVAEGLPKELETLWGIEASLPLKIETKSGPSWGSMTKDGEH